MRIGCIGLGHIGCHLAANLLRAGHDVTVHDLDRGVAEPLDCGDDGTVNRGAPAAGRRASR